MLGSVLAQQGLQLQSQVMNKAISVQPFMQPVGLGNVTLQPISSLQALSNGSQSGHLGIGQIQVVGQPTVMTINQSGQPVLAKAMSGYQLHQSGSEVSAAGSQAGLGASGGGLLIQGNKATLGSPALNGPAVCVSSTSSSGSGTITTPAGLVGFGSTPLSTGVAPQTQNPGQIMQNVIIQRTPTPIQPKPPQGGAIQGKLFKPQQQSQPQQAAPQVMQNDAHKALGLQQIPVSAAQNVAFLTGKPGSNVVLSTRAATQGPQFQQTLFKQHAAQPSGKPLSVHLLNQQGSIVIPSQTVLQGQNHQFLLPQLQAGGQILTQHPGGHIITSQGPGGQLIANQILTANQNINLGQVLTSQGHAGAAHILSGPIQLQPGQMGTPTLFQMPVASLAQSQSQTQTPAVSGHAPTVIQGMPIQNSLTMVPSAGPQQPLKIQGVSSSPALTTHTTTPPVAESPQPSQSPLTLSQQIQSLHHQQPSRPSSQPQSQTPSRSCTPSSHPSLFIIQNQIAESPKPAPQQTPPQQAHVQVQLQPLPQPASQPAPYQPEMPPVSQSPKPPSVPPAQHQFAAPPTSAGSTAVVRPQLPIQGLTAGQQQHLQFVGARIQTLSSITQPSPQQKQLLEKFQQFQQDIMLQAKPQPPASSQFGIQLDVPVDKAVISSSSVSSETSAQLPTILQPTSVLVKTPATASSDLQGFSGAQGPAGAVVNQTVTPVSLTQPTQVQPKPGVISSVGGMALGKGGMKIQVLGPALTQMPAPQPPAPIPTQTAALKMPLGAEPSKEARVLEQLRKHQGSVLHPSFSAPFHSFEDTLHRLLPYHVYQGTANSSQDYQRVDDEFEKVSCLLLQKTQAMLDKYRNLLFSESEQRLGPSAEMVMIDRMFIQEEKVALNQDKILAKERPDEFVASVRMLVGGASSQQKSLSPESSTGVFSGSTSISAPAPVAPPVPAPLPNITPVSPSAPSPAPVPPPAPIPAAVPAPVLPSHSPFPPTKLVIKQGGGGASVSWSTSCPPAEPVSQNPPFSSFPAASASFSSSSVKSETADDDDALPQRISKPPIKTYEARRRIGLKLKIKQDQTGFSKVVHNTALDPVHTPQPQLSGRSTPEPPSEPAATHSKSRLLSTPNTVIRTQSPGSTSSSGFTVSTATTQCNAPPRGKAPPTAVPSSSTSSSSTQLNGTLEHHGFKHNPASTATPSQTTCRLPLRKTYRENVSPRVRPGVPGGGDDSFSYPRTTPSPPRHEASSPPSERTVIASIKVEKRDGGGLHTHTELSHDGGHLGNTLPGRDKMNEMFNHGIKTTQHHRLSLLIDKDRGEEHTDQDTDVSKYKRLGEKNRQRTGGTFRMDQHAPGPPSPESSFSRDSLLPAKRCKSDSPDMDNASFSSGSPPDDSLNEHLQCAIDSILNLQQEPSTRGLHIRGGSSRPHQHQSQRPGDLAASSHRPSVPNPSSASPSSSLAQHPQVGGRGHNGSLVRALCISVSRGQNGFLCVSLLFQLRAVRVPASHQFVFCWTIQTQTQHKHRVEKRNNNNVQKRLEEKFEV
uniref:Glioma tumor suppressor candidate region gene 1 n=1 Tax=Nothobranchius pienaari TaxID=704102 RepID=A0A1A8P8Z4_9TELE